MTHTEGDDHGSIRKDFPGGWDGDKINGFNGAGLKTNEAEAQNFFWTLLNWRKIVTLFTPENLCILLLKRVYMSISDITKQTG